MTEPDYQKYISDLQAEIKQCKKKALEFINQSIEDTKTEDALQRRLREEQLRRESSEDHVARLLDQRQLLQNRVIELQQIVEQRDQRVHTLERLIDKKWDASDATAPPEFMCAISQCIMKDPVVNAAGQTYERERIEEWLQDHNTDPLTNSQLAHTILVPNHNLRNLIQKHVSKQQVEEDAGGARATKRKLDTDAPGIDEAYICGLDVDTQTGDGSGSYR
jgi:hypothetical protein